MDWHKKSRKQKQKLQQTKIWITLPCKEEWFLLCALIPVSVVWFIKIESVPTDVRKKGEINSKKKEKKI